MRAFLALLVLCLAAPASADDLRLLDDAGEIFGLEAVGRLDFKGADGRGFCTATLIGARQVLTAAHCLVDERGIPHSPAALTFRPGLRNGESKGTHAVARYALHPDYVPGAAASNATVAVDVALIELATPVDHWAVPPLRVDGAELQGQSVQVVSYAQGREAAPSHEESCSLLRRRGDVLMLDCQATFGASGAPVFVATTRGARIVGVISSGGNSGDRPVTFAASLDGALPRLEAAMPGRAGPARPSSPGVKTLRVGDRTGQGGSIVFHRPGG